MMLAAVISATKLYFLFLSFIGEKVQALNVLIINLSSRCELINSDYLSAQF